MTSDHVFETPAQLMARLKLGREELCQRLLTTLLLHGPYPRWNSRSTLAAPGLRFLRQVHERSFGDGWPDESPVFVDEFELAPRTETELGGAPDYAVLWDDRVWLIELKTEKGSHRPAQVPYYFELAHHHYPEARVDLTYLTGPMEAPHEPDPTWARYAHVEWADLLPLIRETWPHPSAPGQREVLDGLVDAIDSLHLTPREWRERLHAPPSPQPVTSLDHAMALAEETAADHEQRGVQVAAGSLQELMELRLELRDRLAASPPDSPLRHVRPWVWRPESTGSPLTEVGREHGMEIRLSWYQKPI